MSKVHMFSWSYEQYDTNREKALLFEIFGKNDIEIN